MLAPHAPLRAAVTALAPVADAAAASAPADNDPQWTFLVTATASSKLATGRAETARETIVRNWKDLDQQTRDRPTMELLLRLSQAQ